MCAASNGVRKAHLHALQEGPLKTSPKFAILFLLAAASLALHADTYSYQIIAGAVTFGVCIILWVLEWVSGYETATWAKVLAYISVMAHYESFGKGVLDLKDAIYYATLIFVGLFLTSRSLESLRWRS